MRPKAPAPRQWRAGGGFFRLHPEAPELSKDEPAERCARLKDPPSLRRGSKLPDDKAVSLFDHLAERCGVRSTARLVGVNRNTVVRYSRLAGPHARFLHDEFVAFSPSNPRDPVR
jgi:hypothetical protein